MRRWIVGWAVGLSACHEARGLELPEVPGAKSLLLVHAIEGREGAFDDLLIHAFDLGVSGPIEPVSASGTLTALFYEEDLAQMQLQPGEIPLDPSGRDLPGGWRQAHRRAPADAGWRAESPPPALLALKIAGFDLLRCVQGSGSCVEARDQRLYCTPGCQPPDPPQPPSPPVFPCPAAWAPIALDTEAPMACAPPPLPARARCPAGQWQAPGATSCATLGSACPADGWPAAPPGALYVDPRAPDGGDGSRAAPLRSLAAAMQRAPEGATIALAATTVTGSVGLDRRVTIIGACTERTLWRAPAPVRIGAEVALSDLRFEGELGVAPSGALALSDAALLGAITTAGGRVDLQRVALEGVAGVTLTMSGASSASVTDAVFSSHTLSAIRCGDIDEPGPAQLELSRVDVVEGQLGIDATAPCTIDASGLSFSGFRDGGLHLGPGSAAVVREARVEGARGTAPRTGAEGGFIVTGGRLELEAASFRDLDCAAVVARDRARVELRASYLSDIGFGVPEEQSGAVMVSSGATAALEGVAAERIATTALLVAESEDQPGARIEVADLITAGSLNVLRVRYVAVEASRWWTKGSGGNDVETSNQPVTVRDLDLRGPFRALVLRVTAPITVERMRCQDCTHALELSACYVDDECLDIAPSQLRDLDFRGGQVGLLVERTLPPDSTLDHFSFADQGEGAVLMRIANPLRLRQGSFLGTHTAFLIRDEAGVLLAPLIVGNYFAPTLKLLASPSF